MEKINVELSPYDDQALVYDKASKKLGVKNSELQIYRKSIDARHKNDVKIVYSVGLKAEDDRVFEKIESSARVVVVGAGPAGLFCALTLVRHGLKPIVIERGSSVDKRAEKVDVFMKGGKLDLDSNVQFGEGGAGTFSDGKLNTGVNNQLIGGVLRDFVKFGAPDDILYSAKPHIGSDRLRPTVKNIREYVVANGGRFIFDTTVSDFVIKDDTVKAVVCNGEVIDVDFVVLAIGHSARDTFKVLKNNGVAMEQKAFAVGLRVEQLQEVINESQYGKFKDAKTLPPADYKLVSHASERSVFTFCMCPGGVVVPASSEDSKLVVNGMSYYARDGKNANSAVIAQVGVNDFPSSDALSGVEFQRMLESKAFLAGGGDYRAPVELAEDFVSGNFTTTEKGVLPTYSRGYEFSRLENLFPKDVAESLKKGLFDMDGKIKGFASDGAILTGVESRTSSPVRILRNENFESVNVKRLYPCGEGCGYAGGITSAALDGVRIALAIVQKERDKLL